jgi:Bacterial Ig-like domain (group 3)
MAFLKVPLWHKSGANSVRKRRRQRQFAAPAAKKPLLEVLEARTLPSTASWVNPAGGNWDTPSNWSTASVPGPGDDVLINLPGVTVTHSTSLTSTVDSLTLSQATLTLSAPLQVTGAFTSAGATVTGGSSLSATGAASLSGSLTIGQDTTLDLSGSANPSAFFTLTGTGTVTVTGQLTVTGIITVDGCTLNITNACATTVDNSNIFLGGGGTINNYSSNFTTQGEVFVEGDTSGNGIFNNLGTIIEGNQIPSGLLVFNFGEILNNSGTIEAQSGTFLLVRAEGYHSGSFLGDSGSGMSFSAQGGTPEIFTATSQVVGDQVTISADPYRFYGRYQVNDTQLVGDGFDYVAFLNGATLPNFGHSLSILGDTGSGPTLDLTGTAPASFALPSLTIAGHGTIRGDVEFDIGQTTISGPGSDVTLDGTTIRTGTIAATSDAIAHLLDSAEIIVGGTRVYQGLAVGTATAMSPVSSTLLGQPVTFTATVSTAVPGFATPTGSVDFFNATTNTDLGSVSLSGGTATMTTSPLPAGNNLIRVSYSGDNTFLPSVAVLTQQVHYKFSGFLAPLNSNLALALNRTVPVKFQLTDSNGKYISSLSAVTSLQVLNAQGANALTNAGSTALRYDSSANQFVANWQTKGLPADSYTVTLTLADGTVQSKLVQLSANGSNANAQAADGSDVSLGGTSGQLMAGNLEVYVDNSNGALTPDELARVQDAITAVDAATEPYGVTVEETTDATQAQVTLRMDSTSPVGGYSDGILGCFDPNAGQITMIAGWNWYAGSDPTQIGSSQYDFQTTVTHELGHALGLGEGSDPTSAMYGTLAPGAAIRTLTTADLNLPTDGSGADGQHAAPLQGVEGIGGAFATLTVDIAARCATTRVPTRLPGPTVPTAMESQAVEQAIILVAPTSVNFDGAQRFPGSSAQSSEQPIDRSMSVSWTMWFPSTARHQDTQPNAAASARDADPRASAVSRVLQDWIGTTREREPEKSLSTEAAPVEKLAQARVEPVETGRLRDYVFAAFAIAGVGALPAETGTDERRHHARRFARSTDGG